MTIALKSPALHLGHATVHATLTLHSTAKGLHATTVTQPVRLAAPDTAKPPVAETKEASGIEPPSLDSDGGPGGAVVAGVVNPEGAATSVHFEYGAAANFYPFSAPAAHPNLPADNVKELVTANLTQLWWGQSTIHYRVVAQSAGGTSFGADRTLHVPLVMPRDNSIPQPIDDVTVAGPVTLLSTGVQCSPLGPVVTGARLLCAGTAYNPQQSLWNVSSGSPVVVRPASGTLALHSSGGSDWAIGATSSASYEPIQFPAVVPTASGQSAPAQLIVMHPAGGQLFVQMLGGDGNASVTVVPTETPRLTATLTCRHKGSLTPGATVSCTASLANTGIDAADLDSFKLTGTHGLQPIATTAGAPPAVQQGSVNGGAFPTTTTEAFRIPKGARVGQAIDVTLVVTGRDETDRLPFVKTASASITVARPPSR